MTHINLADIIAYVSDQLGEEASFELELHLADCDQCAEKVFQYHMIKEHFHEFWETLSLEDISRDLVRISLLESLSASTIKPELMPRIENWITNFYRKTQFIIGLAMDSTRKTAEIIKNSLLPAGLCQQLPRFDIVGAPVRVLGEGDTEAQPQKMQGPGGEEIHIYQSEDALQIKIKPSKLASPAPLIWAFSLVKDASMVKEAYHPEETDYFVAEFSMDELADLSKYILLLESSSVT